jgi:hypothetical protein
LLKGEFYSFGALVGYRHWWFLLKWQSDSLPQKKGGKIKRLESVSKGIVAGRNRD